MKFSQLRFKLLLTLNHRHHQYLVSNQLKFKLIRNKIVSILLSHHTGVMFLQIVLISPNLFYLVKISFLLFRNCFFRLKPILGVDMFD
ncbi:hypothetical protein BpHYR1_023820 [Brachionus plicatilis]|uniref:Uncharacterized protein n=1 Tax=Brachionus plicatilis TaxID=10195 RepID=A0A3M7RNC9_BRAPC|nr:hypothetical protein BpHYR1_023820 [Brachionus plicatilis]